MEDFVLFYPSGSLWHQIDPRTKLIFSVLFMILSLLLDGIWLFWLSIFIIFVVITAKIPFYIWSKFFYHLKWIFVITFLVNLFVSFQYPQTLYQAFLVVYRLGLILVIALWLNLTTAPTVLIDGLMKICKPLSFNKKSHWDLPFMMNLVLRFIPELLAESDQIRAAQIIRGIAPENKPLQNRTFIRSYLIPLFILSFRKSASLAIAMNARGYRLGEPRTSMNELRLKLIDYLLISISGIILAFIIFFTFRGIL